MTDDQERARAIVIGNAVAEATQKALDLANEIVDQISDAIPSEDSPAFSNDHLHERQALVSRLFEIKSWMNGRVNETWDVEREFYAARSGPIDS